MPITGLWATFSAYGWAVCDLFDELDEGVDIVGGREVAVEVGEPAGSTLQLGQQAPDLFAHGPGDDDSRALADQTTGEQGAPGYGHDGDGAVELGPGHSSPSAAAASRAASTSALVS